MAVGCGCGCLSQSRCRGACGAGADVVGAALVSAASCDAGDALIVASCDTCVASSACEAACVCVRGLKKKSDRMSNLARCTPPLWHTPLSCPSPGSAAGVAALLLMVWLVPENRGDAVCAARFGEKACFGHVGQVASRQSARRCGESARAWLAPPAGGVMLVWALSLCLCCANK